jgi:pseudouridine kinase
MKTVFCIGGALIDETFTAYENIISGTSNPSKFNRTPGGVSQNVANHLSRLGNRVELITHFGNDHDGKWLMKNCIAAGIGINNSVVDGNPTGRYIAIVGPDGNLFVGAAAMFFEKAITKDFLKSKTDELRSASIIQIDCNLSKEAIEWIISFCREEKIPCIIEPVSVVKARKLYGIDLKDVLLVTPNEDELKSIAGNSTSVESMISSLLKSGLKNIWLRQGKSGSVIFNNKGSVLQPASSFTIEDVTGAGDASLAGFIHYFLKDRDLKECIVAGQAMAELILTTQGSTLQSLNENLLEQKITTIKK